MSINISNNPNAFFIYTRPAWFVDEVQFWCELTNFEMTGTFKHQEKKQNIQYIYVKHGVVNSNE